MKFQCIASVICMLVIRFTESASPNPPPSSGSELTFELPDNEKMCFYEVIDKNVKCTLEFQVIIGGNYDVDMELTSPSGQSLYKDMKKKYDHYTWTTSERGEYRFCFSNEFSTFTHKIVYFDFQIGDEPQVVPGDGEHATAMTQMEAASIKIHESLRLTIEYQTSHRLRESQGRAFGEHINERVQFWSIGQSIVILVIGVGQVIVLKGFFTDRQRT